MPTATDITIEDDLAKPGVGRQTPKAVFFAVRFVNTASDGEGATLFEVSQALADKDQALTDEEIARSFILLREKGLIEQCGTTEFGRIIVRPTQKV